MSALETTKTEDMRQCTLCQQYGDSAPRVSLTVLHLMNIFIINEFADCFLFFILFSRIHSQLVKTQFLPLFSPFF